MDRRQEKAELSRLNERFSNYIDKVRKMREEAHKSDSTSLLNAIRNLEDEVNAIKGMYENELEKLRAQVRALEEQQRRTEMAGQKNNNQAADAQARLADEQRRNQALAADKDSLKRALAAKDQENKQLKDERDELAKIANELKRDNDALLAKNHDDNKKLEKETLAKKEALAALANLQKQQAFRDQVSGKELGEYKNRSDAKDRRILELEKQIRDLARSDSSLHDALARVRETAAAELKKYKKDSEAEYAKNLQELRDQMQRDAPNVAKLAEENKKLKEQIEDDRTEINALKNKIRALEQNRNDLITNLQQERQKSVEAIKELERKLKELQDTLIRKLQQMGNGQEPPIGAEIEALKALIAEEENRLGGSPSRPGSQSAQYKLPMLRSGSRLASRSSSRCGSYSSRYGDKAASTGGGYPRNHPLTEYTASYTMKGYGTGPKTDPARWSSCKY